MADESEWHDATLEMVAADAVIEAPVTVHPPATPNSPKPEPVEPTKTEYQPFKW